jgi:Phasin protein
MSNRSRKEESVDIGLAEKGANMLLTPALALRIWKPLFADALNANARAQEGFGTIAREWQSFVGHRLEEDISLLQRLTHSRAPDQVLGAYCDFWSKAAEDYSKQFATIAKLTTKVVVLPKVGAVDAKTNAPAQRAAA